MQPSFQNPYLLMTTPLSLNSGRYDAAIVDLDGTLVDTLGDFVAALRLMLADVLPPEYAGVTLEAADVGSRVGKGSEHLVQSVLNHVFAQAGRSQSAIDSVAYYERAQASYQRHYAALNGQHAALYPGVLEGLGKLQKSGLRMAMCWIIQLSQMCAFAGRHSRAALPVLKAQLSLGIGVCLCFRSKQLMAQMTAECLIYRMPVR